MSKWAWVEVPFSAICRVSELSSRHLCLEALGILQGSFRGPSKKYCAVQQKILLAVGIAPGGRGGPRGLACRPSRECGAVKARSGKGLTGYGKVRNRGLSSAECVFGTVFGMIFG